MIIGIIVILAIVLFIAVSYGICKFSKIKE